MKYEKTMLWPVFAGAMAANVIYTKVEMFVNGKLLTGGRWTATALMLGSVIGYMVWVFGNSGSKKPDTYAKDHQPADRWHQPLLDELDDVMFNHKSDDRAVQQAYEDDVDHARSLVHAVEAHFLDDVATDQQLDLLRKAGFELKYPHKHALLMQRTT